MGCPSCGHGFHNECEVGCTLCHAEQESVVKSISQSFGQVGAPVKDRESVLDSKSTGRKRAAMLYPINKDASCEWRRLKNVGGGHPIIGCVEGLQRHRHHGPIKDTLRNEPGNVHRICHHCHNRWHAQNDPVYDEEEYSELPHAPEGEATDLELAQNEAYWALKKV